MDDELERATMQFFGFVDRKDAEAVIGASAQDIQSVDEISRQWLRGIDELGAYIRQMVTAVEDVHTMVGNVQSNVLGDTGIVTCWVEQDYTLEGKRQHVSAPTTIVFRREGGAWKVVLFHSVPLPPETA